MVLAGAVNPVGLIRSFPWLGSVCLEISTFLFFLQPRSEPAFRFGGIAQDTSGVRAVVFEYSVFKDRPGVRLRQASPEAKS